MRRTNSRCFFQQTLYHSFDSQPSGYFWMRSDSNRQFACMKASCSWWVDVTWSPYASPRSALRTSKRFTITVHMAPARTCARLANARNSSASISMLRTPAS